MKSILATRSRQQDGNAPAGDAGACDGGAAGRVKGTSGETTMQIQRHFVWQATTALGIYAKAGRTLCTHSPAVRHSHARALTHAMDDPLPATRLRGQTSHFIGTAARTNTGPNTGPAQRATRASGVKCVGTLGRPLSSTKTQGGKSWLMGLLDPRRGEKHFGSLNLHSSRSVLKSWRWNTSNPTKHYSFSLHAAFSPSCRLHIWGRHPNLSLYMQ